MYKTICAQNARVQVAMNLLRQLGFTNIIEADDGTSAWERMQSEHVDFVVSDWNMPKMTGFDFLKLLLMLQRG